MHRASMNEAYEHQWKRWVQFQQDDNVIFQTRHFVVKCGEQLCSNQLCERKDKTLAQYILHYCQSIGS